ncbi:MAG: glucose-1-phosphate thymidylyltransferase RfbA [Saezia sp.]
MKSTYKKAIILAGGSGSRLAPVTFGVSKQLLPVYDKPMIYYPLSVLLLAGFRNILVITTPHDQAAFRRALGDGSQWGVQLSYAVQDEPQGIAHALLVAEEFIGTDPVCLILGDNLFYGQGFSGMLHQALQQSHGASVFVYPVHDVSRFGAVTLSQDGNIDSIVEKPAHARDGLAITGLYFFDAQAVGHARALKPSARGELEVTELLQRYLQAGQLHFQLLGRGFTWLDMGTSDALLDASHFVQTLEKHQGFKIACLEEVAWRQGWVDEAVLRKQAAELDGSPYGTYLKQLLLKP